MILFSTVSASLLPISVSGELPEQKLEYLIMAGIAYGVVAGVAFNGSWVPYRRFRQSWGITTTALCAVAFVVLQHPLLAESRFLIAVAIYAIWILSAPAQIQQPAGHESARPMLFPVMSALRYRVIVPGARALVYGSLTLILCALAGYRAIGRHVIAAGLWLRDSATELTTLTLGLLVASLPQWVPDTVVLAFEYASTLKKGADRQLERIRRINETAGRTMVVRST